MSKWQRVIDNNAQPLLNERCVQLLTTLETHIHSGCLSAIPPNIGDDNFNDVKTTLNTSISHCRIGIPLVSALFSKCLFEINRARGATVDFQEGENADVCGGYDINNDNRVVKEGMSCLGIFSLIKYDPFNLIKHCFLYREI